MKKVVSLMLVLVLALGMATMAYAASTAKVDKALRADDQASITKDADNEWDMGDIYVQDHSGDLDFFSDPIEFTDAMFTSATRNLRAATAGSTVLGITEKEVKESKITLKTVVSKGASAVKTGDCKLVYDYVIGKDANNKDIKVAQVRLRLADELKTNNSDGVEYTVKFYLVVDGRQWTDSLLTVNGTLKNRTETSSDATDGYVWMGDGVIIEADGYAKNVEMDLDNGVSVFGKMFNGKKYWAISNMDSYNDDEDLLMDKYDIDTVYHIKQVGVAAVADYVKLNDESSDMFVYDGDLNYLAKGNEKLPFSETYYLSAKQLEIEEDEEPIDEEDPSSDDVEDPGDLGGDDFYPENVNDNPGTGR